MRTHEHLLPPKTVPVRDTDQRAPVYWLAVTDVPCPVCETGTVRWAEARYIPDYRICDGREAHFFARGTAVRPMLGERSFRWRGLTAAGIRLCAPPTNVVFAGFDAWLETKKPPFRHHKAFLGFAKKRVKGRF